VCRKTEGDSPSEKFWYRCPIEDDKSDYAAFRKDLQEPCPSVFLADLATPIELEFVLKIPVATVVGDLFFEMLDRAGDIENLDRATVPTDEIVLMTALAQTVVRGSTMKPDSTYNPVLLQPRDQPVDRSGIAIGGEMRVLRNLLKSHGLLGSQKNRETRFQCLGFSQSCRGTSCEQFFDFEHRCSHISLQLSLAAFVLQACRTAVSCFFISQMVTLSMISKLPVLLIGFGFGFASATERPNIVLLLTDDQTVYSLGCYGNEDVKTPHIDQLAADGMVFDHHYNTTAICMASRATIFTGLFEYRHGCNFGRGPILRETWEKSYPVLLRRAGYRTAIAGKIGIEVAETLDSKGTLPIDDFDVWGAGPGQTSYSTAKNPSMAKYSKKYPHSTLSYGAFGRDFILESAATDSPFCLSISFKAPHMPATPDPRFDDVYARKTFRKPDNFGRKLGEHFSEQSRQGRQYARFHDWGYADRYDEVMAIYHQQVHAIDVAVGMIRKSLEEANVADETFIVFTSDNGFLCGSHGYGSKVLPYEESSKAPLILYRPGHDNSGKNLRSSSLTGNVDLHPTLLELAGIPIPQGIDGLSLLPLYDQPTRPIREHLPLINVWGPEAVHSLSIVTKDWKFVRWPYNQKGFQPTEELFFLREDPLELKNEILNPEHNSALEQKRKRYIDEIETWSREGVPFRGYPSEAEKFRP